MNGKQLSEAWKEWLESDAGMTCSNPSTLKIPESRKVYLENRLWHAFMAGVEAAETLGRE